MSNLNTSTALVSAAAVSDAVKVLDTAFRPDDKVLDAAKAMPYGAFAMREIVKGLRATEKGNRHNVIHHVGQVVETVARNMRDDRDNKVEGEGFLGKIQDGKAVPPGIERALKDTLREVIVAMIKAGDAPYLNCEVSVARIRAMPRDTAPQRKLWDYQARKLADSTLFLNGQAVEKPKGKFLPESLKDAKSKEFIESLKVLRNYTNKIVSFMWAEHAGVFQEFAFRTEAGEAFKDLDAADVESIAAVIETKAPGGMSSLAHAFRKPAAPADDRTPVQKMLESFAKMTAEDRAEFLKLAQTKHGDLVRAAENAEKAVNKESDTTGADVTDIFADLRDEVANAA
jgi:hypothetical protein